MEVEFDPLQNKRQKIVGEIYSGPEKYNLKACFEGYSTNMHLSIKNKGKMVYSEIMARSDVELNSGTDEAISQFFEKALKDIENWEFEEDLAYIGERDPSKLDY